MSKNERYQYHQGITMPILIIPDIHGRTFWEAAVKRYPDAHVVFLGDYLDPYYERERITDQMAMRNLLRIIEFKRTHPNQVTLLLGNHDIHYINNELEYSRKDTYNAMINEAVFTTTGAGLFEMAFYALVGDCSFLFTHAGVLPKWWKARFPNMPMDAKVIAYHLNDMAHPERLKMFTTHGLDDASPYRGGDYVAGLVVWADMDEHAMEDPIPYTYQIFGHTQLDEPVITEYYANLDCRRAFILKDDGRIYNI